MEEKDQQLTNAYSSVKKLQTLEEVVQYINLKHKYLNNSVDIFKFIKYPNGQRKMIQEVKGGRIYNFDPIDKNVLIMTDSYYGQSQVNTPGKKGSFKLHLKETISRNYICDLVMINLYDYSAEFLTTDKIDISYVDGSKATKTILMAEWIQNINSELRAQWILDPEMDELIDEMTHGSKKINVARKMNRNIEIEL